MHTFFQNLLILVLLHTVIPTNGIKILGIFMTACKSHYYYNSGILRGLSKAGHEVTIITPFPEAKKENFTVIDSSENAKIWINQLSVYDFPTMKNYDEILFFVNEERRYCRDFLKLKRIQEMLHSKNKLYDVILVETLTMYPCFLALAEKWRIPVIGTITLPFWSYADRAIDNPRNPAFIPDEITSKFFYENFINRCLNVWNNIIRHIIWNYYIVPRIDEFHKENIKYLKNYMAYREIRPSLIFYNGHSSIFPRPMNPNAIEIGGIHISEVKPLPKKIKHFLDESRDGVVLFSLGSILKASSFKKEMLQALIEAFTEIPQSVIWKFEKQIDVPKNILIVDWLPQRDILAHNNTKAFISHCGMSGTYEAIYEGVPIIAIPVFDDQMSTAEVLERYGAGVRLSKEFFTKKQVLNALNAVINDKRYSENMKKLSIKFRDRPLSPQESVVYWTEYVHRHDGASNLKTAASRLNWIQYYLLDVFFVFCCVVAVLVNLVKFIFRIGYKKFLCKNSVISKSKKFS